MKVWLICLLPLLAPLLVAQDGPPRITAFGTGVVEGQPDILRWHLTVSFVDGTPAQAAEATAGAVDEVLRFLREQEIGERDVQTSQLSIDEEREHRASNWVKVGYRASADIAFNLRDPGGTVDLWSGLADLEGIQRIGLSWDFDDRSALESEARLKAIAAAREKAREMAEAAGVRLMEPLLIEELGGEGNVPVARMAFAEAASDAGAMVAPGRIPIRARVQMIYRIVSE